VIAGIGATRSILHFWHTRLKTLSHDPRHDLIWQTPLTGSPYAKSASCADAA